MIGFWKWLILGIGVRQTLLSLVLLDLLLVLVTTMRLSGW